MINLIAAISMVIDHAGSVLYPESIIFRILGRFAFPMFACQVAISADKTSNILRYIKKMMLWALVAQLPYMYVSNANSYSYSFGLNVMVTFSLAVFLIYLYKEKGKKVMLIGMLPVLLIAFFGQVDYGVYGVLTVLSFYFLKDKHTIKTLVFVALTLGFTVFQYCKYGQNPNAFVYLAAIGALIVLDIVNHEKRINFLPGNFFYIFYPAHMLVLASIKEIPKFFKFF